MTSKKILTIIYLNRSIALAKVSFSGKTANVSNYSEFALPDGTIENAIVYDPRTVSGIVKEYINAVGFKQIDKSVACIPDNKVKIIFYKYNTKISESENEEELTNLVETEMNTAMPQLSVITDTYTSHGETQTVVYAIRKEILDPYITSSRFGASIFPASIALSQALSKNLNEDAIVLYPRGNSLRFFIFSQGHVIANDVEGKNVLDIDNNLSNGIREIISYGESLSDQPIKKVLFVEGKKVSKEDIKTFMVEETGFDVEFFRTKDATLDQYKFLALKGLIKKVNDTGLEKPSIKKRIAGGSKAVTSQFVKPNHVKIAILATIILALAVVLVIAMAWSYYSQNQRKTNDAQDNTASANQTVTPTSKTTPITQINLTVAPTPTNTPLPVVTSAPVSNANAADTTVKVLNGSGTKGEASTVSSVIKAMGFKVSAPGDLPPFDTQKTIVRYTDGYDVLAQNIADKLKDRYPLISTVKVDKQDQNIVVVTGVK